MSWRCYYSEEKEAPDLLLVCVQMGSSYYEQ